MGELSVARLRRNTVYQRWLFAFVAAALAWTPANALAQQSGPRPSIAVLDFNTNRLTSNVGGSFERGVALSDLVSDQMVNSGRFNVLDRTHLSSTLGEHQLGASGEVDPQSAITAGKMTGAR